MDDDVPSMGDVTVEVESYDEIDAPVVVDGLD